MLHDITPVQPNVFLYSTREDMFKGQLDKNELRCALTTILIRYIFECGNFTKPLILYFCSVGIVMGSLLIAKSYKGLTCVTIQRSHAHSTCFPTSFSNVTGIHVGRAKGVGPGIRIKTKGNELFNGKLFTGTNNWRDKQQESFDKM